MFYILSDTEVAFNEILVACQESIDYFESAIARVEDENKTALLQSIVNQRKQFSKSFTDIIRRNGDLPAMPDPDKETGEMIIEQVAASLSDNDINYVISHRIENEMHLQALTEKATEMEMNESDRTLLQKFLNHIQNTVAELSSLI